VTEIIKIWTNAMALTLAVLFISGQTSEQVPGGANSPAGVSLQLNEELNHKSGEQNETSGGTELRNQFGQGVELQLQGSALGITR
jgi:hypothetical protein